MIALELLLANKILNNTTYRREMDALRTSEQGRIFCRHDIEHCLSVARIAMLLCMEHGIPADADTVYAAALLHDIGRTAEYTNGIPHQIAGKQLAAAILTECGCPPRQQDAIQNLIAAHRQPEGTISLEQMFYLADKRSRSCFACPAQGACNWEDEKRTMKIEV